MNKELVDICKHLRNVMERHHDLGGVTYSNDRKCQRAADLLEKYFSESQRLRDQFDELNSYFANGQA